MKVITWQAPSGETINITPRQERVLTRAGAWPRTARGAEYCTVSHGQHDGEPSLSDAQVEAIIARQVASRN